jgi:hypothetical protein
MLTDPAKRKYALEVLDHVAAQDLTSAPAMRGQNPANTAAPDPQGLGSNMPDPASGAGQGTMPASVARRLPALARAAQDPNAPASLKAIHRLLAQQLENELRG